MLIALPPSEGKHAPARGRALDLDRLSRPELGPVRERALEALERLADGPRETALAELGLGPRSAEELDLDRRLRTAPTAPARDVYTGVLHERLGLADLAGAAKRRASARVVILSALWGALAPTDRIPAYRCPAGARLPGLPTSAALWGGPLAAALPDRGLVVDLRSGGYRTLWRPAGAHVAEVHVVRDGPGGRTAVSHMAKATRGTVGRLLLEDGGAPRTVPRARAGAARPRARRPRGRRRGGRRAARRGRRGGLSARRPPSSWATPPGRPTVGCARRFALDRAVRARRSVAGAARPRGASRPRRSPWPARTTRRRAA